MELSFKTFFQSFSPLTDVTKNFILDALEVLHQTRSSN